MGVQLFTNITPDEWERALNSAAPMGMGWLKVQASWRYLEPDAPGHSPRQTGEFYSHLREAKAQGYNVMVSVAKTPDWARSVTDEDGPPDDPQDLANFITAMLGAAGDSIDAIEIWNEPNIDREWMGTYPMTGQAYMELFAPSYQAVRAYSPDIVVISAGLAPTLTAGNSTDDRDFLRQMYQAGLGNYQNVAVGVHPYGWGNAPDDVCCVEESRGWDTLPQFFFLNTMTDYRNIMLRYGDSDAQLWVTEFGWTSWQDLNGMPPEAWMAFIDNDQQADYIVRAFEIGQSLDYVGPMFLWNFNFANPDTIRAVNEIAGFSMVIENGEQISRRPVYDRLLNRLQ